MNRNLREKIKESLISVIPVTAIVLILSFTLTPVPAGILVLFIISAFILILGMGLFTLGADASMMPMGEEVGSYLSASKKLWFILPAGFLIGAFVTMAEPDLSVLAELVPSIPKFALIAAVSVGVGLFLAVAFLRTVFRLKLSAMLIIFYIALYAIAAFAPASFLAVAFDSGGVTTGPITVPFILALGVGVASVRGGKDSADESFGLVALCSIGPILSVLILSLFYKPHGSHQITEIPQIAGASDILDIVFHEIPHFMAEVALALAPIVALFFVFQIFFLKLTKKRLLQIVVGLVYTYLGLVLFLTGANIGFIPVGSLIGSAMASLDIPWLIIPLGVIMGFVVVLAEPAVHVLNKEVEEVSSGAISKNSMLACLSIGVGVSVGLSMFRVYTGISIWYLILPGYAIALGLSFFVPSIYTAIAFDSGGVASGPMTATFLLAFSIGACEALGGDVLSDAFGIVAMVAMTPLLTIQIMGLAASLKQKRISRVPTVPAVPEPAVIIDLDWEALI